MSHFIADAIRAHIGTPQSGSDRALLAVVDKCEAIRNDWAGIPGGGGHFFATEFELTIARELNVAFPLDRVEAVQRLLGH
jgi:hypothetical protein